MRSAKVVLAASFLALLAGAWPASGQTPSGPTLTFSLFERYLDSLRAQAAIPGMSFAVIQNDRVWYSGLGKQDLESNTSATPDTPYNIAGLSQTLGAAMLLRTCLESDSLELNDRVVRWVPQYPDETATVAQLLTHTATGQFAYDLDRFAGLTEVIVECADVPYAQALTSTIFEPFGMASSAPGTTFGNAPSSGTTFAESTMTRFADVLRRTAPAYRVERGRATRVEMPPAQLSAASGVISSVTDLVRFIQKLESGSILALPDVVASWTQARALGAPVPTGLGWFVQNINGENGEPLIWQFGQVKDGHSALLMKLPARGLTFIALANSDGLTAPYNLQNGDAKASPFAALFLKFFLPQP